jgi:hypothetical protein
MHLSLYSSPRAVQGKDVSGLISVTDISTCPAAARAQAGGLGGDACHCSPELLALGGCLPGVYTLR